MNKGLESNQNPKRTIVSIIVSHQNRIKCFLNSFMKIKYGLANCSIIKLTLSKDKDNIRYDIELIYEGGGNIDKKYYAPKNKNISSFIPFEDIHRVTNNFIGINPKDIPDDTQFIFFIIRHGNSIHNEYTTLTKIQSLYRLDTTLTENGQREARDAGIFLRNYLQTYQLPIHMIFSSDLKRTRQTLTIIMSQLKSNRMTNIVVLPCAHELHFRENGSEDDGLKSCDRKMISDLRGALAGENKMDCDTVCNDFVDNQCCVVRYDDIKLKVDWRYYNSFYDNKKRDSVYYSKGKYTCTETNMIRNALNILFQNGFK